MTQPSTLDLLEGARLFTVWLRQPPHDVRLGRDLAHDAFSAWVARFEPDSESDAAEALRDAAIALAAQAGKLA